MPISIDGTGSITGLTAGGLPDGSVATADIASGAITAPKLDGAQSGSAPIYGARAWVNFAGATGTINASGNVIGVTRNSTGTYTITFSTAMADANYSVVGTALLNTAAQYANVKVATIAAGSVQITTTTQNSGNPAVFDPTTVCVTIFR
jgi:hypothetical protein